MLTESEHAKKQVLKFYPAAKVYSGKENAVVFIFDENENPLNGFWSYNTSTIWQDVWNYIQEKLLEKLIK